MRRQLSPIVAGNGDLALAAVPERNQLAGRGSANFSDPFNKPDGGFPPPAGGFAPPPGYGGPPGYPPPGYPPQGFGGPPGFGPPGFGPPGFRPGPMGEPPPNYLVQAILVTLCCCIPGGIVAIVYSTKVNSKWQAGDYAGAQESSDNAKMWVNISAVVGLLVGALNFLVNFMAAASKN